MRWENVLILGSHSSLCTRAKPDKQRPAGLKMYGPKEVWNLKRSAIAIQGLPQGLLWAKALQLCPILWDPVECSPPSSSVHGIFQARILEGVAIPFSRGSSQPRDQTPISCISRWVLYHWATREVPNQLYDNKNERKKLARSFRENYFVLFWLKVLESPHHPLSPSKKKNHM